MGDTGQEVMGKYGEVEYSPKPQDEENPSNGMMYRRMEDMAKAREGKGGAGRERRRIDNASETIHPYPIPTRRTHRI